MMNTFYYDEQVRALEKQYARDCEAYLQSEIEGLSDARALQFLVREAYSNSSTWSGGFTLKNYEHQVRRDIALDLARQITNKLVGQEERHAQV